MLVGRGATIVALWIAARWLGAERFGGLSAAQGTVVLLSSTLCISMRLAITHELARPRDAARSRRVVAVLRTTVVGTTSIAAATAALATPLATHVLALAELAPLLRLGALLLVLDCFGAVQLGVLTACRELRRAAIAGAVASAILVAAVAFGSQSAGAAGAFWGFLVGAAAGVALRWRPALAALRRAEVDLQARPRRSDLADVARTALPAAALSLLWAPTVWLGSVLLVRSPGGYVHMGQLGAATQWFSLLLYLPNVLGIASLPLLSAQVENAREALRLALRSSLLASTSAATVVACASPWIMRLYGADYAGAWPTLATLAAASVPAAAFAVLGNYLTVSGRWRRLVASQFAWAAGYLATAFGAVTAGTGSLALALAMLAGNVLRIAVASRRSLR